MPDLSDDQIADLRLLQQICEGFHADLVIMGNCVSSPFS